MLRPRQAGQEARHPCTDTLSPADLGALLALTGLPFLGPLLAGGPPGRDAASPRAGRLFCALFASPCSVLLCACCWRFRVQTRVLR